jgi:undecaprenyl-diphosphatase
MRLQLKGYELILKSSENIQLFLIGNLVAFIVAIIAIKFFIEIIKNTVSSPGDGTELLLVHFINLLYIFKIILFEDSRRFPKRTNFID